MATARSPTIPKLYLLGLVKFQEKTKLSDIFIALGILIDSKVTWFSASMTILMIQIMSKTVNIPNFLAYSPLLVTLIKLSLS